MDSEVKYFWRRAQTQGRKGITWTWALFLANRYLSLINYIYQAPWWPVTHDITGYVLSRCAATVISQYLMEYSQYALWGAISCGRVHMLRRNWILSLFVLVLGLTPIASNIALATYYRPVIVPPDGCMLSINIPFHVYQALDVIAYTGWILSELIVVAVTLSATWHHRALQVAFGRRGLLSISAVLFRDGLFYFVVIAALNLTQLTVGLLSLFHPAAGIDHATSFLAFVPPLTSILLTRLFFNLQETAHPHTHSHDAGSSATQNNFQIATADLEVRFGDVGLDEESGRVAASSSSESTLNSEARGRHGV
ncbi:hypothetical protein C8Q77DRAFT_1211131 [Trametes polyzona]|nr:hypothetical protein C8Q77DRAFT_1211131 [Trametes polyzona]